MAVKMHGMELDGWNLFGEVGETLFGDDEVDVALVVIFRDHGVVFTEGGVFEV